MSTPEKMDTDEKKGRAMGVIDVGVDRQINIPEKILDLLDIQVGDKVLIFKSKERKDTLR